jgi:DNA-dependent RNA polymerase auxiliary subunit epsilon
MKIKILIILLLSQIAFSREKNIIIMDGIEYSITEDRHGVIDALYEDAEKRIYKTLKPIPTGEITINEKKYKINSEYIEHFLLQEQKTIMNYGNKSKFFSIFYSKNKKYPLKKSGYWMKNNDLNVIEYNLVEIEKREYNILFLATCNYYNFDENGKIIKIELGNYSDEYLPVFRDGRHKLEKQNKLHPPRVYEQIPNTNIYEVVSKTPIGYIPIKTGEDVKEYIKERNYKIENYETVNGENLKVFEMIFNKDLEIVQLFMRKIDYLDGTIGETITIKFDKGKIFSEIRGE